jgi:hypothetical protein
LHSSSRFLIMEGHSPFCFFIAFFSHSSFRSKKLHRGLRPLPRSIIPTGRGPTRFI